MSVRRSCRIGEFALRCLSRAGVVCIALAWVPLAPQPSQAAAQIQVSTVPAYGQSGSIIGRVTGITDFANYDVVTYLYVDGIGWYPNPRLPSRRLP
jgi:hypothetical protein